MVVQPAFLGKLGLEIGVYQKSSPIGETFGEVSESLRLLRFALVDNHLLGILIYKILALGLDQK